MKDKIIMHIDMNSYFASVEQQANPFLRGRPVGVCAYLSPGGCIIASSVEAKAKGVKTGFRVRDARQLCPEIFLVENEPSKYRSTTEKIFDILDDYSDKIEHYSIDEAFLDLTGWANPKILQIRHPELWDSPKSLVASRELNGDCRIRNSDFYWAEVTALIIRERIKKEVGEWMNCSIGISYTKFLAKFASDIAPKKGILMISKNQSGPTFLTGDRVHGIGLDDALRNRDLQDAWGINKRMEIRLNSLGITDLLELKNYSQDKIKRALGSYGYYLWANVNGIEISEVRKGQPAPKSVGHSYCLPKKTRDKKYLGVILYKLCEKTGRRLRCLEMEAQRMHIAFAYTYEGGISKSFKTPDRMFTTEEIFFWAGGFLEKSSLVLPVRLIAVSVGLLSPFSGQMALFHDNLKPKKLNKALDKINDKYGEYTITRGAMFGTGDMARDRIGFRKTV